MTQNTEQNVRTRDEQIIELTESVKDFDDYDGNREVALRHILEAEARGAEEQRRKDAETERRFRHVKRGTEYRLIGRGKLQQNGPSDMAEVIIYQDVIDGSFWVRSPSEFYDGRFKELFSARAALTREGGV